VSSDPKGLGALFDAHTQAEFKTRDIEATMATMSGAPHVTHVPTMTGGSGRDAVRRFYQTWFIGIGPRTQWSRRSRAPSARTKWSTR
jgi:carboxymethylenebutenolidase